MVSLGEELVHHCDEIVDLWFETWCATGHARPDLSETAIKDDLPRQLRAIGEQLCRRGQAEEPDSMWKEGDRMDPEARVYQGFKIEEVVQEYRLAVDTVRTWIDDHALAVSFNEYSYFYAAMFELTAESVRRYAECQADQEREERAKYLASVMHQMRTPLSVLAMQTEQLAKSAAPPDAAAVARLRRNVRRVRVLVDAILRLERYKPEDLPVRPTETTASDLVEQVLRDHELHASRKGLRFEAHLGAPARVLVDPDLFDDALGNLVQNAVKYTTDGFVVVDVETRPDEIAFHVRDSGPGIAPEQLKTLFRRVQPGTAGGAGIGLQIADHAAQAQGGHIDVESTPGSGSVFTLTLPRRVSPRDAPEEEP